MVMNMNHLHIFVKVGEKLNITEAAKELFISQPAVSKAIKNLESSLQLKLLIRDKHHGLMLTDIGKEILLLARQMKGIESKIYQVANRENKLLNGKVKIGSFSCSFNKYHATGDCGIQIKLPADPHRIDRRNL